MADKGLKKDFNILVIEDDDKVFGDLEAALKDTNYNLSRVSTGAKALKMVRDGLYLAIISEVRLRDINGNELVRRLKKLDHRINIIVLTAYSFTDSAVEAMRNGAYAYLMKPLNIRNWGWFWHISVE